MARVCLYVDGFNVYHALDAAYPHLKWLNYRKLAESVLQAKDALGRVCYFSSFVTWKPQAVARHKVYIKALQSEGVDFIRGQFKTRDAYCHLCHRIYTTHEEKQTDVNVAVTMLADAVENSFDKAILVTADSDLMPVILTIRRLFPDKRIGVMFPIGRNSFELRQHADFILRMPQSLLKQCQFPDTITIGKDTICRPSTWK